MKKTQLLLAFFLVYSFGLKAQSYIKVNPLAIAFGFIGVNYEQVTSDKNSFTAGASFITSGSDLTGRTTGFGVDVGYRFYLTKDDAPKGLYVSPVVGFNFLGYKYPNGIFGGSTLSDFSYSTLSIGGLIGYQWLFSDDKFSVELGIGPSYGIRLGGTDILGGVFGSGIGPVGAASIGYRLSGGK